MNLNYSPIDPELAALLERGRIICRVPDVVRARALARARTTMAAGPIVAPVRPAPAPWYGLRIAAAATVAMAIGAAAAAAALHRRTPTPPSITSPVVQRAVPLADGAPVSVSTQAAVAPEPVAPSARIQRRSVAAQESYAAELELLQRAQTAYANGDYLETLAVVAKHGRRFPKGRLSEEREALRVRSLAASGQADEARRAGAAFPRRFPRSVLLPHLQETANPAD